MVNSRILSGAATAGLVALTLGTASSTGCGRDFLNDNPLAYSNYANAAVTRALDAVIYEGPGSFTAYMATFLALGLGIAGLVKPKDED